MREYRLLELDGTRGMKAGPSVTCLREGRLSFSLISKIPSGKIFLVVGQGFFIRKFTSSKRSRFFFPAIIPPDDPTLKSDFQKAQRGAL
jgi:hypothetical protein